MDLDKIAFPPAFGTTCLTWYDDGSKCWHRCEVLGATKSEMDNGYLAVVLRGKHEGKLLWASEFRKIKTEREIVVESAMSLHNPHHQSPKDFAEALYDAGMLRLPPRQKMAETAPVPTQQVCKVGDPFPLAAIPPNYDVAYQIQP